MWSTSYAPDRHVSSSIMRSMENRRFYKRRRHQDHDSRNRVSSSNQRGCRILLILTTAALLSRSQSLSAFAPSPAFLLRIRGGTSRSTQDGPSIHTENGNSSTAVPLNDESLEFLQSNDNKVKARNYSRGFWSSVARFFPSIRKGDTVEESEPNENHNATSTVEGKENLTTDPQGRGGAAVATAKKLQRRFLWMPTVVTMETASSGNKEEACGVVQMEANKTGASNVNATMHYLNATQTKRYESPYISSGMVRTRYYVMISYP